MKRIYVSQRVDVVADYGERRDALDQCWTSFLQETDALPFPLPNECQAIKVILETAPPDGILLTGGNNPVEYGGNAPERDGADSMLLDYAIRHKIPLIGVCRGMQSVLMHFGGSLREVDGHVAVKHSVNGKIGRTVNSYHRLAADRIPSGLLVLAQSEDGVVEAVRHESLPIMAIMWHPERETLFVNEDLDLFQEIWSGKVEME